MDDVERLIEALIARAKSSTVSKLDVLLDLERLRDPRIVPFLVQVLLDEDQPAEVRQHVLKRLRSEDVVSVYRPSIAHAILRVLADGSSPELRLQAALALAEFTAVDSVLSGLGNVALDTSEPLDLRYSAFTSLERAGPTPECTALLQRLRADETLGPSARSLLSTWQLE